MAISQENVKKLQTQIVDLGELIHAVSPVTDKEWMVYEAMVDAHRKLRRADTDALLQLALPLKEKDTETPGPRKDCPRCWGSGQWLDPADKSGTQRLCLCKDVGNASWPQVEQEWEKELATVEA